MLMMLFDLVNIVITFALFFEKFEKNDKNLSCKPEGCESIDSNFFKISQQNPEFYVDGII